MIQPWNGEQITEAGAYSGLPIDDYFAPDICRGPSISSSGLRTIWSQGPAAWWWTSPLNPNAPPPASKDCFDLGRAAHTLLLGESGFYETFAIRPAMWPDWRTKAAQEWRAEMTALGFTILTPENIEQIRGMAGLLPGQSAMPESGLANSRLVQQGLLAGAVETSLFWIDKKTGVWLKARPDVIPRSSGLFVDLKTHKTQDPMKAIFENGYHAQAALIAEGAIEVLGVERSQIDFIDLFVQTVPPFRVTPIHFNPYSAPAPGGTEVIDLMAIGVEQNRAALDTFARCLKTGEWPAADGQDRQAKMPKWYADKLTRWREEGTVELQELEEEAA
jgi:hypothetical protein